MDAASDTRASSGVASGPVHAHGVTAIAPGVFRFGAFELDGDLFELRRAGRQVAVQPKVLRLLFYLTAHRDRVVSSDELLLALWPNETVCAASLKRAVSGARRALGDCGHWQQRIQTVRKYGYRFVLDEQQS